MKLLFKIIFIFILTKPVFSDDFKTKYQIKNRGIIIGSLTWALEIKDEDYTTTLKLKNKGWLSSFYTFEGKYKSAGKINNNYLFPKEYSQTWKTRKKEKIVKITYKNKKIEKIFLSPAEKEAPKIKYKSLKNYNDPLTSFLNILFNNGPAYTVDGRRAYLLKPTQKEKSIKIFIEEYSNIWADHKRNDLEFIEIFVEKDNYLPKNIKIMFKGSVFLLSKI